MAKTKETPNDEAQRLAAEQAATAQQLDPANIGPEPDAEPEPAANPLPIDNRSPAEILANPGRALTYGEILDLEARVRNAAA